MDKTMELGCPGVYTLRRSAAWVSVDVEKFTFCFFVISLVSCRPVLLELISETVDSSYDKDVNFYLCRIQSLC